MAPETEADVRDEIEVIQTGDWYVASLDEPALAVVRGSPNSARESLVKRWKQHIEDDSIDIVDHPDPYDESPINHDPVDTEYD